MMDTQMIEELVLGLRRMKNGGLFSDKERAQVLNGAETVINLLVEENRDLTHQRNVQNKAIFSGKNNLRNDFAGRALTALLQNNSVCIDATPIAKYARQVADELVEELTGE